jgi:hypothetical protein
VDVLKKRRGLHSLGANATRVMGSRIAGEEDGMERGRPDSAANPSNAVEIRTLDPDCVTTILTLAWELLQCPIRL